MPYKPRSSGRRGSYKGRGYNRNYIRKNDRIRAPEIRVIGPDGRQLGVMHPKEALTLAKKVGLDLVEVSASAKPPVCRILDYGKYQYEQSKKQKESKTTSQKIKEIKLRVRIDTHDYMTKIRRAEEFLAKGNKLKCSLQFRGREMEHKDLGFEKVKQAVADLIHIGAADMDPKLVGRSVSVVLSPLPEHKRVLKYNDHVNHNEDKEDDKDHDDDDHENDDHDDDDHNEVQESDKE